MFMYTLEQMNSSNYAIIQRKIYSKVLYTNEGLEEVVKKAYLNIEVKGVNLDSSSYSSLNLVIKELVDNLGFVECKETFVSCEICSVIRGDGNNDKSSNR